jgi:hypothetical protein
MKITDDDVMRELARRMSSQEDILCLHALAQPLVSEMQDVIRYQKRQLDRCADALEYALNRISRENELRNLFGAGTETYERLTAAAAEISGDDVDSLRDQIIPGSASIHKRRTQEEEK